MTGGGAVVAPPHFPSVTRTRSAPPKHHEVFTTLLREIQEGHWQEGQRLPSEAQLTERFGLSRITVGRALRDLQAAGVISRRAGAGSFVSKHTENGAARSFGVLIADLAETEIYEAICRGMMASPLAQEHALLFGSASRDLPPGDAARRDERAWHLCQQYIEREVDGVFFAPVSTLVEPDDVNHRIVQALDAAGIPIVLLDRPVTNYPDPGSHDLIGIDNRRAGYVMTTHLLDRGAQHVIFVRRPNSAPTVDARESGYRQAMNARQIPDSDRHGARLDPDDMSAVAALLDEQRPDGIVCSSDRTAARLMHTMLRLGVRIPNDVRLVGIDDVDYATLLPVPLTTLRQPTLELGVVALSSMLTRVAHRDLPARDIRLKCELVVRESCGAPV
jgi:GntR family transcriptional regulator, arabinose operon transcriptional repressor